jgi:four helix bundle protein
VKSSTSIGANYTEANGGSSKKDFINKVFICKKEAKETMYWLRLVITLFHDKQDQIAPLFQESKELFFIFSKICSSSRKGEDIKN